MRLKNKVFGLIGFLFAVSSFAQNFNVLEGTHFRTLADPVLVNDPSRVEVVELFWYGCPHCDQLDPAISRWVSTLPDDVSFRHIPVVLGRSWEWHARLFWAARNLGVGEKVHRKVFDEIHRNNNKLDSEKLIIEFLEGFDLEREKVSKELKSFSTESALKLAHSRVRSYEISGVPALIVHGRYLVNLNSVRSNKQLFNIVDNLIEKSRKHLKL